MYVSMLPGIVNVRETCRLLHTRVSEHTGILAYTAWKELSLSALSNIIAHKRKTGHDVSLDDFSIVSSGCTKFDVLFRQRAC